MKKLQTNVQGIPPDKVLVVMIDFQNGFCHPDSNLDDELSLNRATALRANEFAKRAADCGAHVVYTQQILDPQKLNERQREWAVEEGLCEKHSWSAELFIDPIPGSTIVTKYRYDLWRSSEFLAILEEKQPQGIIFAGIELCCCVLYAVLGADERGYRYSVPMDLVSGIDSGTNTYNRAVRELLTSIYGAPQSGEEILREWEEDTPTSEPESSKAISRLYGDLSKLWPLVSVVSEYAEEAGYWRDALRSKLGPGRHEVLELGAGGGHNLSHLTDDFSITATDLSENMLQHCRELNPGVPTHLGDMRTLRLNEKFKAVMIHDAISHMLSEDDLRRVFATAAAHLDQGGLLVIAPDHYRETFVSPRVEYATNTNGDTELTIIDYQYDPDPTDTVIEGLMFYIMQTEHGLLVEQDKYQNGLFALSTWIRLMEESGFAVEKRPYPVHPDGRLAYLLVGTWQGNQTASIEYPKTD